MARGTEKDYDHMFKLLIVGQSEVGKTALLKRYTESTFDDNLVTTIGIDFRTRTIDVGDKKVKLQIWDTAGQERFRTIGTAYYRNTHGVIIVYDVTSRDSFSKVEQWIREIKDNCEGTTKTVLVGNKDDDPTRKVIQTEEAQQFSTSMQIQLFETSAKENINVEEMFYAIAERMVNINVYKTMARGAKGPKDNTRIVANNKPRKKTKGFCVIL